ncbi:MAG TPA: glutamate-1-semialdehyde 2,1-aminomutase, partial [Nannocystaceae bacterium]|nr:glutamate-1-semialdehyde 2,1-aminomutase [Nannocystaceae bacterium]
RGFTGRPKISKAEGGYHGHADMLLVAAGAGAATLGIPGSAGVTQATVGDTLTVPFNDEAAVARCFAAHPGQIAAIIIEPIAGNMGCVPPRPGYLQALRELCSEAGALLIFDEVMTGFRVALGGAQELYGVDPDLTCLGKIVGGGMPVGAYGGKPAIMRHIAPLGPVYQAGTLSGNPLGVAAGLTTLRILERERPYAALEARSARLVAGLAGLAERSGIDMVSNRVGSMFTGFFCGGEVWDYAGAKRSDTGRFARFHREMLARGFYLAPSQFEAAFVSVAHDDDVIDATLAAAEGAFAALARAADAEAT